MEDLIYKFKEEHRRLALEFQRISCGVPSRELKFTIKNLHDKLFSHLESENQELYPPLKIQRTPSQGHQPPPLRA